jgi:hypothetical protein
MIERLLRALSVLLNRLARRGGKRSDASSYTGDYLIRG